MAGGFSDWLNNLPSPGSMNLSSAWGAKRGDAGYIRGYGGAEMAGIGPNQVPAMWQAFAPHAQRMIDQMAGSRRSAAIGGSSNARRDFERSLFSTYANQGIDQQFAQRLATRERPRFGQELQSQLGGIETQRLGDSLGLMQGIQNATTQSYLGERDLAMQMYLASKARQTSREGAKDAMRMQAIGAIGGSASQLPFLL